MVATDADKDDCFVHHSVGVDSRVGLYVIDGQGRELSFSPEVQESIWEALGDYFHTTKAAELAVLLSTATN
jgi:hypothetical protein